MVIKDINEFTKLYKINIPYYKEFEYYINTLSLSPEYFYLPELVKSFSDFETSFLNGEDVSKYKMQCFDKLYDYITKTKLYERFQNFPTDVIKSQSLNNVKHCLTDNKIFVSIDISSANFTSFKLFDNEDNSLKETWEELCKHLNIHPIIYNSKSFRQLVFGNLNPKRSQRLQQSIINDLFELFNLSEYKTNIVYLSHDEIILVFDNVEQVGKFKGFGWKEKVRKTTKFHTSEYMLQHIKKDIFLKYYFSLKQPYKKLIGVPGNQYFVYFKKYVLKEEILKNDLYFYNDNQLAQWVLES